MKYQKLVWLTYIIIITIQDQTSMFLPFFCLLKQTLLLKVQDIAAMLKREIII